MAADVSDLIEWLGTLPPGSYVFVDEGGLTLMANTDDWYEVGGAPDGEEKDD